MTLVKIAATTAAGLVLALPGSALAAKGGVHPDSGKSDAAKGSAPGQVCKSMKVKGKKTAAQRAAFKACVKDAVAKHKAQHAAKDQSDDAAETDAEDAPDAVTAPADAT